MSTELYLPTSLPFPIKILKIPLRPPTEISRGTNLLSYSYTHRDKPTADEPEPDPEVRYGTWDSPIEGVIEKWTIRPGDTVSAKQAREKLVLLVNEPCKHGMQLGGLCCLCGKDMTEFDYTGFSDASRASIQMTHSANGPTVSFEEARRIEQETATHLLKSQKLTLIVDLDQTIVHATVDPTVGDWISEGEAWEARQAKRRAEFEAKVKAQVKAEAETNGDGGRIGAAIAVANGDGKASGLSLEFEPDPDDEVNPNWEALRDVKKFRLGPEAFLPPTGIRLPGSRKGKERAIENEGCLYYVKPRPGWREFLAHVATKYEMHVYTMGTRAYAEEVCAAIDPGGVFFGGRILSRDESGSLTQKSLQRLFPCDTSMVVIIDDRADVWEWSPNLVKVIPYDFFVGIGDINSAFLPKIAPLTPSVPSQPPSSSPNPAASTPPPSPSPVPPSPTPSPVSEMSSETVIHESSPTLIEPDDEELEKRTMLTRNSIALEAQVEQRPLAKKQEELEEQEQKEEAQNQSGGDSSEPNGEGAKSAEVKTDVAPQPLLHKHTAKALLRNDDYELLRVGALLDQVHQTFYDAYEVSQALKGSTSPVTKKGKRRPSIVDEDAPLYDVKVIIPAIRQMTFAGFKIVFSSVIPLDVPPETTDIWRTAVAFGAECYKELNPRITHVVANKRGTAKVDQARRLQRTTNPSIKIVWLAWFNDSLALWGRQDETPYLLDDPSQRSTTPPSAPPTQSTGSEFGSMGNGGSEGDDDLKSNDDVDDAEIEGHAISSDPEPDADDWDFDIHNPPLTSIPRAPGPARADGDTEATGTGTSTPVTEAALKELEGTEELKINIDWALMNDEFDAWMEGDSSDEGEEGGGERKPKQAASGNGGPKNMDVSEDDWTDETNSTISTPRSKRKRLRSLTPSEANSTGSSLKDPLLRSPLSKRKKLSAGRFGAGSKLRESHTIPAPYFTTSARSSRAGSLAPSENGTGAGSKPGTPQKDRKVSGGEGDDEDNDDDGSEEAFDIDDDFLAREMEEELG